MASQIYIQKAEDYINTHPYLMLAKSWCPDCQYANKIWERFDVSDKVHTIELDKIPDQEEAAELEKAFIEIVGKGVPKLFFNGKNFGTDADLKKWESEDKLEEIFKQEKLI
ncbi:uncharacterized protein J8A68_006144 [[Candida] subhashii]|uniref:Glutaredoxin domain-containing protein n=1 Tax=[Candida] subhashii TaxID=561895 RepID=A0A8J5UGJ7_9ASCO|nr:uncharacterized protein J8A68_006144 [[Candida] subhashii]KAG7660347.1 hypothetical protein J8A68_006144 [[Candida] subhashii]